MEFNTLNDFKHYLELDTYGVVENPRLRVLGSHGNNSQRWSLSTHYYPSS